MRTQKAEEEVEFEDLLERFAIEHLQDLFSGLKFKIAFLLKMGGDLTLHGIREKINCQTSYLKRYLAELIEVRLVKKVLDGRQKVYQYRTDTDVAHVFDKMLTFWKSLRENQVADDSKEKFLDKL